MGDYYGVSRSDEYLEHWGIAKGGQKKNHKYLMRVPVGSGWRYLYTPAEVAAYYGKGAIDKAGRMVKSFGRKVASGASYGVKRVRRLFGGSTDSTVNGSEKRRGFRAGEKFESIQSRLKKTAKDRPGVASYTAESYTDENGSTRYRSGKLNAKRNTAKIAAAKSSKDSAANGGATRSYHDALAATDPGRRGIGIKTNNASGKGNNVRTAKKRSTRRQPAGSIQYNPTFVKVKKTKKLPLIGVRPGTIPKSVPFIGGKSITGTEMVSVSTLGRAPKDEKYKKKAKSDTRFYKK